MTPKAAGEVKKKDAKPIAVRGQSKSKTTKLVNLTLSSKRKKAEVVSPTSKASTVSRSTGSTKVQARKTKTTKSIAVAEKRAPSPRKSAAIKSLKPKAIITKTASSKAKGRTVREPDTTVVAELLLESPAPVEELDVGLAIASEIGKVDAPPIPIEEILPKTPPGSNRDRTKLARNKRQGHFLAAPIKKGKKYNIDLRIHSPGTVGFFSTGGVEPGAAFVRLAKVKGLEIMAVTDHNNAEFIDIVKSYAENSPVTVIPGVDLCCRIALCHEVYLIALFPENRTSADVFGVLAELGIPSWARGKSDYVIDLPFGEVVRIVESHEGVLIPTRLDKTPFRQLALPTIVDEYGMHVFDIIHPDNTDFFEQHWPNGEFTFFCFSNANSLAQVGSRLEKVRLMKPGFEGIKELVKRRVRAES